MAPALAMIACGTSEVLPCGDASCDPHTQACLTQTVVRVGTDASSSTYTCISASCDPARCDCVDLTAYDVPAPGNGCACSATDAGVTASCVSHAGCYGSPPTRADLFG